MTITPTQLARLKEISTMSQRHWADMRRLEEAAYAITKEDDKNGYTSDLIWQSDASVERILEALGITVEEVKP